MTMSNMGLCFPLRAIGPQDSSAVIGTEHVNVALGKTRVAEKLRHGFSAVVTLPMESVVLVSINCLKISWESCLVASSTCA